LSSASPRRCSASNRSRSVGSLLAVGIAVFGLLIGGAVLDREQRLQLLEVVSGHP